MFHRSLATGAAMLAVLASTYLAPARAAGTVSMGALVPASAPYDFEPIIVTGKCDIADSPAHIMAAYPLEWPDVAAAQRIENAATAVQVDLDSRGTLVNAAVVESSGNDLIDATALRAARLSRYAPEVSHCNRFARSYMLDVVFE